MDLYRSNSERENWANGFYFYFRWSKLIFRVSSVLKGLYLVFHFQSSIVKTFLMEFGNMTLSRLSKESDFARKNRKCLFPPFMIMHHRIKGQLFLLFFQTGNIHSWLAGFGFGLRRVKATDEQIVSNHATWARKKRGYMLLLCSVI